MHPLRMRQLWKCRGFFSELTELLAQVCRIGFGKRDRIPLPVAGKSATFGGSRNEPAPTLLPHHCWGKVL